ncbi:MAG: hypothetical protein ACKVIX_05030 [Sphingomonadales bacterium]
MKFNTLYIAGVFVIAGATSNLFGTSVMTQESNSDKFFDQVNALCGQAFSGGVDHDISNVSRYSDQKLILHIRDCSDSQIKIPLHVGDNSSRILIFTKNAGSIKLQHDHRHQDGTSDDLTLYGGYNTASGVANAQSFSESTESTEIFKAFAKDRSRPSVWSLTLNPEEITYQLVRPGMVIAFKFDLSKPVAHPPIAWDLSTTSHN